VHGGVLYSGFVQSFPLRIKEQVERDSARCIKGTAEIVKRKRREGNTVIQFNDGKDSQLILEFWTYLKVLSYENWEGPKLVSIEP
jgi:hypothetical protein